MKIAALRQIGFVAGSLHLLAAESVDFLGSCLKLLLNGQSNVERQRSYAFPQ